MLIDIIKSGVLVRNNLGMILHATSTVSLISSDEHNLVVDTGLPGEAELILKGLSKHQFTPDDIDIVVNTHLHGDHMSNNSLFRKAEFIVHMKEMPALLENIIAIQGDYSIGENINIIETPGHTRGSISVVVNENDSQKIYIAAGDALPIKDNYIKWVPPGINYNPKIALASMKRIVDLADFVIPGHDDIFEIQKQNKK
jgi:glyoxylase-like metal-dependent hydrolase (beta-lactamase superfamily II)